MTLLITIAFVLSVTGCFIMLDLSPFHFLEELGKAIKPPKTTIKSKIESTKKKQKTKGMKLFFLEIKEILRLTGKQNTFSTLCVLAMILFVLGAMIAISMSNTYLIPVMAVGFGLLPFYYVKFTANKHKKALNSELETTLSVITTSYMRNNNTFINAVEENLNYLNPPMYDMFADFLVHAKLFDTSLREALQKLKLGFNNAVFEEWVDTIMDCQEDHNLKNTLPVIVSKLSDMRIVSVELDAILFEPVKEYITMVALVVGSVPLMYFLNKEWYQTLMHTEFGKVLLAISGIVIVISIGAVAKHTKPIEYER